MVNNNPTSGSFGLTGKMEEFHTPPSELVDMDRDNLEALQRALVKLAPRYRTNQSAASRETSARVPRSSKR